MIERNGHGKYGYDEDNYPIAPAVLEVHKDVQIWRCICPYCLEEHTHGGGKVGKDPTLYLGHRIAHCCPKKDNSIGYVLKEVNELP